MRYFFLLGLLALCLLPAMAGNVSSYTTTYGNTTTTYYYGDVNGSVTRTYSPFSGTYTADYQYYSNGKSLSGFSTTSVNRYGSSTFGNYSTSAGTYGSYNRHYDSYGLTTSWYPSR